MFYSPNPRADRKRKPRLQASDLSGTLGPALGGTGVSNNASSTLTISGNFGTTLTVSGTTSVTLPTSGTLLANSVADQTISGGANVTSLSQSTGNITIDCGARPLQYITNGGAYTITAPSNDGSCVLLVTNNASAGATTFSGFTVGSNTGDALTTTNASKFMIFIIRINGTSSYTVKALQ